MAIWIRVIDDAVVSAGATPANGASFTLEELQKMVGGYIEPLRLNGGKIMWLNEEGKLKGLPYNPVANLTARQMGALLREDDMIVGDVVIADETESGENEEDDE